MKPRTEREQTSSGDVGIVGFCLIFRRASLAHNGLVAGSSPAGPTNFFNALRGTTALVGQFMARCGHSCAPKSASSTKVTTPVDTFDYSIIMEVQNKEDNLWRRRISKLISRAMQTCSQLWELRRGFALCAFYFRPIRRGWLSMTLVASLKFQRLRSRIIWTS